MTTIAWDGKSLSADKRVCNNGVHRTTTKIRKIRGHLCAVSGEFSKGMELFKWFEDGANPDTYPKYQLTEFTSFLVITPDLKITKYENTAYPMEFEDKYFAMGSGRDFALAAMYLGKNSSDAVAVAMQFDVDTGNGVETLVMT